MKSIMILGLVLGAAVAATSVAVADDGARQQAVVMKRMLAASKGGGAVVPTGVDIKGGSTYYALDAGKVHLVTPRDTRHAARFWAEQSRYGGGGGNSGGASQ